MTIKRGEFVVIFGTSGGGKTTMLNIIGTIDKPTKGELKLSGFSKFSIFRSSRDKFHIPIGIVHIVMVMHVKTPMLRYNPLAQK